MKKKIAKETRNDNNHFRLDKRIKKWKLLLAAHEVFVTTHIHTPRTIAIYNTFCMRKKDYTHGGFVGLQWESHTKDHVWSIMYIIIDYGANHR